MLIFEVTRGGPSRPAALTALPEKCKGKDSAKFALSLGLVTKFHNTNIFITSDTILAQPFLVIQQNHCNWLQETWWFIRLSQGIFDIFWRILFLKTGEMRSSLDFTTWISWILNFTLDFKQCSYQYFGDIGGIGFKSGRQSRAAKIQPFLYLQLATVSWWAVYAGWRLKMMVVVSGDHSWTTKGVTDLKHLNEKCGKHTSAPFFISWWGEHCSWNWFRIQTFTWKA